MHRRWLGRDGAGDDAAPHFLRRQQQALWQQTGLQSCQRVTDVLHVVSDTRLRPIHITHTTHETSDTVVWLIVVRVLHYTDVCMYMFIYMYTDTYVYIYIYIYIYI